MLHRGVHSNNIEKNAHMWGTQKENWHNRCGAKVEKEKQTRKQLRPVDKNV